MLDYSYIAGLFDGEGCINIYSHQAKRGQLRTRLRISIGNTHLPVLQLTQSQCGGAMRKLKGKNSPVYVLTMDGGCAIDLLEKMLPFLIIKKDQAFVAIEYWQFMHGPDRYEKVTKIQGGHRKSQKTLATEMSFKNKLHSMKRQPSYPAGTLI